MYSIETTGKRSEITKRAEIEYAKANYDEAYRLFREAIQKGDTTGKPRFFLGLIVETRRQYKESIGYFKEALQRSLDKKYAKVALWKVILYMHQVADRDQLFEYASQLRKIIGENKKLNEIVQDAEANAVPVHREAQKLLNEASSLEAAFLKDKNKKNFWQDHESKILETASIYEAVYRVDTRYGNYLWRSAYYYENTNQFEDALKNYQSILAFSPNNARVKYKIGIIYKKQMKYQLAEKYLHEVYKQRNLKPILNFYTAINLSQIYYFFKDFPRSNRFARKALSKRYRKHRNQSQNNLLHLLSCNTDTPLKKILAKKNPRRLRSLIRNNKSCSWLLNRWKKLMPALTAQKSADHIDRAYEIEIEKTQIEYILSRLLKAKQSHLDHLLSKKIDHLKSAEKNYVLTFLPEWTYQIGGGHMDRDDPKDELKMQDWPFAELGGLASFLYQRERYLSLYDLLFKYRSRLEAEKRFNHWLAASSFQKKEYKISTNAYLQITDRNLAEEKKLLLGYSFLEKWYDLKSEIHSYIHSFQEKKTDLISFINSEPAFEAFRDEDEYEDLMEELKISK